MRSCSAIELSGVGDRDELDLPELVLAQHAAGIAAGRTCFRAEARRQRREAQRQLFRSRIFFAHQIGQRTSAVGIR
jgi:hypothetical protein